MAKLCAPRPAKSPGISGSPQKSLLISRSPGNVTKPPGILAIWLVFYFSATKHSFGVNPGVADHRTMQLAPDGARMTITFAKKHVYY